MASNVTLNSGTGGASLTTKQRTHDGDTTQCQSITIAAVSGTEDAYTFADIGGDATNGLDVDVTRLPALAAGTNNIGDVDVLTVPAPLSTTGGGTEATALRVTVASDSTGVLSVDDNGGSLTVDGTVTANAGTGTFTVDSELPAAAALADATANPTTPLVGAALELFNGTTWDRVRGDTTNGIDVDVTRLPALAAGTNNIGDVDVLTVPAPLSTSGGGTEATALRVTIASDSTGLVSVDDNGGSLTVDVGTALPAGTNNIGDVDVLSLPAIPTGTNSIGRVNPEPQTANGLTISRTLSAASTNATSVKGSAGQVYTVIAHNINAAVRYLKLYNKATAPTVGTDTPVMTLPIPANAAGAGFVLDTGGMGIAFATGIGLAITTGVADADTGAVAANEIVVNLLYK